MYEWDDKKNKTNIEKHGVNFETAVRIFDGKIVTTIDDRHDYNEVREISIGVVDTILFLIVVHTDRNGKTRIISARRANKEERQRYEEKI